MKINSKITIKSISIVQIMVIATVLLVLCSSVIVAADYLTGHDSIILHKAVKLFYVDLELNIPSFFSTLILLMASFILVIISILKRREKDPYTLEWMILAGGFLFMSFDELISVHERLIEPMREVIGGEHLGIFYFAWVIPAGLLVLILGVLLFGFWWNLPKRTKISFIVAAVLFLGGAVGFELLESQYCEIYGKDTPIYMVMTTIEESLEMVGVIVFIKSLLFYINESYGKLHLQIEHSEQESGLAFLR